jgi:alpha-ribazole phosphatase
MTSTRWWWIRHAPVLNQEGRIYGRRDVACDLSDTDAIAALAAVLPEPSIWLSSPLSRTRNTAEALAALRPGPRTDLLIEPDLIEQDFGVWQNRPYAEITEELGGERHPFWFAPAHVTPEGGESFADTMLRVTAAVERLIKAHEGRNIVAVAHAGVIRSAIAHALDLDPEAALRLAIDPLSLTRLDHLPGADAWRVVGVNQKA